MRQFLLGLIFFCLSCHANGAAAAAGGLSLGEDGPVAAAPAAPAVSFLDGYTAEIDILSATIPFGGFLEVGKGMHALTALKADPALSEEERPALVDAKRQEMAKMIIVLSGAKSDNPILVQAPGHWEPHQMAAQDIDIACLLYGLTQVPGGIADGMMADKVWEVLADKVLGVPSARIVWEDHVPYIQAEDGAERKPVEEKPRTEMNLWAYLMCVYQKGDYANVSPEDQRVDIGLLQDYVSEYKTAKQDAPAAAT